MDKFKKYIDEKSYKGNIGFVEMAKFFQKANKTEISQMEQILVDEDWESFKNIINKKLKIKLV